jgi:hypothetical protein
VWHCYPTTCATRPVVLANQPNVPVEGWGRSRGWALPVGPLPSLLPALMAGGMHAFRATGHRACSTESRPRRRATLFGHPPPCMYTSPSARVWAAKPPCREELRVFIYCVKQDWFKELYGLDALKLRTVYFDDKSGEKKEKKRMAYADEFRNAKHQTVFIWRYETGEYDAGFVARGVIGDPCKDGESDATAEDLLAQSVRVQDVRWLAVEASCFDLAHLARRGIKIEPPRTQGRVIVPLLPEAAGALNKLSW